MQGNGHRRYGLYDGTNDTTHDGSAYLNLGIQWQIDQNTMVRLDGYNLLELFDQEWSKRNFIAFNAGSYQIEAASLGLRFDYTLY